MTTDVAVAAPSLTDAEERRLAAAIAALFADAERRFSRFRADSELARLNRADEPIEVSRELLDALCEARRHVVATDGWFDPAIGAELCAAGYDRSFAAGALDRERDRERAAPPARRARFVELAIDPATRQVHRPPGMQIDLGGLIKGRTVDRGAALGPAPVVVDAGGDAMLRGAGEHGDGWLVDVEDPSEPGRVIVTLRVCDRGVATSAANRRRWRVGRAIAHHLIDPRTGRPSSSDLAQVTAVAATAADADVLAKVGFLRGAAGAAQLLGGRPGIGGVLVHRDGGVRVVGELEVADA